jgi:putative copper export protein
VRDLLLFLHIVGAAGWIGGGLFGLLAYPTVAKSEPPTGARMLAAFEKWGSAYFGVTSGLVLLSGVGLVLTSDAFGWSDTFVLIGLGAFLASGIVQSTVGKRANERLAEGAESGADLPAAVSSWRQISIIDIVVLFVVVWAMVTKLGA